MADDITEQISKLIKKDWVNLQGLVECATSYLSSTGSSTNCLSISLLGHGNYNIVYRLVFSDGTQLAARVSNHNEEDFNTEAKLSEIETMKFVRESGLYPYIPVPKVHVWETTFNNLVGAPYVLMDVVEGEKLNQLQDENGLFGLDSLRHEQKVSVVKALAKLKASLSKPVSFDKIGSITADAAGGSHVVGPLMTLTQGCFGGPFESVHELWRSRLEHGMLYALQKWRNLEKDQLPGSTSAETKYTPQAFAEVFQLLSSLIPQFTLPKAYSHLVLHHPDLSLRNIFFDKESLSSGEPKVTGVIDWRGAQVIPFMLSAQYPDDLMTSVSSEPSTRSEYPGEDWDSVPFDYTSIGDPMKWPREPSFECTPQFGATVSRFYLRTAFSSCYAEQLHLLHGDKDLAHATLFAHAPYYLKFHETICGGWESWVKHASWIRETYRRLRNLVAQGLGEDSLIIGSNVYRNSISDLGVFEEPTCSESADERADKSADEGPDEGADEDVDENADKGANESPDEDANQSTNQSADDDNFLS